MCVKWEENFKILWNSYLSLAFLLNWFFVCLFGLEIFVGFLVRACSAGNSLAIWFPVGFPLYWGQIAVWIGRTALTEDFGVVLLHSQAFTLCLRFLWLEAEELRASLARRDLESFWSDLLHKASLGWDQVSRSFLQPDLEHLQGWRWHHQLMLSCP